MQGDGAAEDPGKQGTEGCQRSEASPVLNEKVSGQIYVAPLHAGARLVRGELCVHIVVTETPTLTVSLCADFAERLEEGSAPIASWDGMFPASFKADATLCLPIVFITDLG